MAERIGDDVKETLRTRDVVATATGIVMARKGLDSAHAYRQLLSLARSTHVPLREVAQRIVASPAGSHDR
jgi:AmiR/NasT family two-component response regulator